MKARIKDMFKYNRLSLIMCIITLLIGIVVYSSTAIGIPIKAKLVILLVSFIPFLLFLLITILSYHFKEKYKRILKVISIILSLLLGFYYFLALFMCVLLAATNPVTNLKYYNYYVAGERLENVFPSKIPDNVKNVQFYYAPGILQGGTNYALYYVDDYMTKENFDKKYKDKAVWIGHKEEYTEKEGLLSGAFSFTPADYNNENDYIIYLIEGRCDNSGYCNHGEFLFTAFNEKTNEVVFSSEQW